MFKNKYISAIKNSGYRSHISLLFALGMLAANLMLVVHINNISTAEKTILIPPGLNQTIVVEGDKLDKNYMSIMTRWITGLLKNYHTESAEAQFNEAVRYMAPQYYRELKSLYDAEAERIRRKQASSVWYPIGTDIKQDTAFITGELIGYIGSQEVSREVKTYGLTWTFENSKMELKEIAVYIKDPRDKSWIKDEKATFIGGNG